MISSLWRKASIKRYAVATTYGYHLRLFCYETNLDLCINYFNNSCKIQPFCKLSFTYYLLSTLLFITIQFVDSLYSNTYTLVTVSVTKHFPCLCGAWLSLIHSFVPDGFPLRFEYLGTLYGYLNEMRPIFQISYCYTYIVSITYTIEH